MCGQDNEFQEAGLRSVERIMLCSTPLFAANPNGDSRDQPFTGSFISGAASVKSATRSASQILMRVLLHIRHIHPDPDILWIISIELEGYRIRRNFK